MESEKEREKERENGYCSQVKEEYLNEVPDS